MALNQKLDLKRAVPTRYKSFNLFDRQIDNFICLNTVRECLGKRIIRLIIAQYNAETNGSIFFHIS